jgi:hypothetical protein
MVLEMGKTKIVQLQEMETRISEIIDVSDSEILEESPEFDIPTETEVSDTFRTSNISAHTQINCPRCGGKSYLRDGRCIKCDHVIQL